LKTPTAVRVRTNAKLNLFLRVAGRRPDGYHELESIFHGVGLADDMEILRGDGDGVQVRLEGVDDFTGDLPPADENSLIEAVRALNRLGADVSGTSVHVRKRIPIGSGLGGGSANAAGLLVALNELFGLGLARRDLLAAAGRVGSDVPYCISGGTALALSRGEQLQPLPAPVSMTFVLGMSNRPLLTRDVYSAFDELDPLRAPISPPLVHALGAGDVPEVASLLSNDLERAAFLLRPELEDAKALMLKAGALGAGISGSGPTVYGLAADRASADAVAAAVEESFDRVEVVQTAGRCVELRFGD
jgi:4-diphosphocytidyl-2-C-methyl-D-erythritol kinase